MDALSSGGHKEALALFEAAIKLGRGGGTNRPEARYLSYYGLCLALQRSETHEGLRFCREAVTLEGYNPDIRCNLGRVLLSAGRRAEAHRCFIRGLGLQVNHTGTRSALRYMGVRRRRSLPFLSRRNPVNVFLGRLRKSSRAATTVVEARLQGG